jgi:hypothetical protein
MGFGKPEYLADAADAARSALVFGAVTEAAQFFARHAHHAPLE